MLFVLVLFFLLLGTSVGAYPVGPHPGALYEGIELPKPYKFVTNLIPPDRRPRLNDPQPLLLSNIQHHTGLWYQRPEVSRTSTNHDFRVSNTFHRMARIFPLFSRSFLNRTTLRTYQE